TKRLSLKYETTFNEKRFEFQWKTQGVRLGCHSEEAEMEGEEGLDWGGVGLGWGWTRKGVGLNLKAAFACL
ncbi:MAG: hypothetical protein IKZ27_00765, partial [Kiritimatiellae bacterium]|nr:hypothetical protein [Kiritimatiellia bacterium]